MQKPDDEPCHGPEDAWCPVCGLGGPLEGGSTKPADELAPKKGYDLCCGLNFGCPDPDLCRTLGNGHGCAAGD